jgi:hypothetical protein
MADLRDAQFLFHVTMDPATMTLSKLEAETLLAAYDILCECQPNMVGCQLILAVIKDHG